MGEGPSLVGVVAHLKESLTILLVGVISFTFSHNCHPIFSSQFFVDRLS